jgi:hypothetical protein
MPRSPNAKQLNAVVTPEFLEAAQQHAKDIGVDFSEYLRQAVREKLERAGRAIPEARIQPRLTHGKRRAKPD